MTWCGGNLKLMEVQKYQRKNEELLGVCSTRLCSALLDSILYVVCFVVLCVSCSFFFLFFTRLVWVSIRISLGIFAVPVILPAEMQKLRVETETETHKERKNKNIEWVNREKRADDGSERKKNCICVANDASLVRICALDVQHNLKTFVCAVRRGCIFCALAQCFYFARLLLCFFCCLWIRWRLYRTAVDSFGNVLRFVISFSQHLQSRLSERAKGKERFDFLIISDADFFFFCQTGLLFLIAELAVKKSS